MSARTPIALAVSAAIAAFSGGAVRAAELPVPCVAGVCGANIPGFVTAGRANATTSGNTLTVHQQSDRAILNWASFNVDADGKVVFDQPGANSIALNRIFQGSPSRILGAIEANGQIFLINQNGFMFGPTARVRTSGLMVSSLDMADSTFNDGLLSPDLIRNSRPALESDGRLGVLDRNGNPVLGDDGQPLQVKISIAAGAQIATLHPGERVMLASRTVDNAGQISAPQGQVIVAAGEKVYLQASTDPALRGLLVEVDAGGEAWNRMTGNLSSAQGNVTVVGLAVNQEGRVSATTTVNANGSIRLLARDTVRVDAVDASQNPVLATQRGGTLTLGANSTTSVMPELDDKTTAIDEQAQVPSSIELNGRKVFLRSGAQVRAPGGNIAIRALNDAQDLLTFDAEARVHVESGAVIDASGSDATASVSRNVVRVELRGNELRDAPQQRDGVLRGKTVYVDARVGTPLADVSGAIAGIGRAIDERTSNGGTITVDSSGDIAVAAGATFDVSGGSLQYTGGAIQTTQLIMADGRAVDIGSASPDAVYTGLINPTLQRRFDRWGVTEQVQGPLIGRFDPGYLEGKSAGTLQFIGRALSLDGKFLGDVTVGPNQRDVARAPAGGRFIVGTPTSASAITDFRAPSINFVASAPPTSVGDDGTLPQRPLDLSTAFITNGGFSRVELYSNGVVRIPESMMLTLRPGGSLAITAHRVESEGSLTAAGGTIRFASTLTSGVDNAALPRAGVALGASAVLDVSGTWSNELSTLTPIVRNAGRIDLAVNAFNGELVLGEDSQLRADGGGSLSAAGTATGGAGGQIGLHAGAAGAAFEVGRNVSLSAFGVAGATGGSLALDLPRIEIVSGAHGLGPQRVDLFAGDEAFVTLGDGLFSDLGFSSFDLAATGPRVDADALVVRAGAHVDVHASTRMLDSTAVSRASGTPVQLFSTLTLLPEYQRGPTNVALRVAPRDIEGADAVGRLSVEEGASIDVEARGNVALTSVGGIDVAGDIRAPAGTVTFAIPAPAEPNESGYLADLGIRFRDSASVDVSGLSLLKPSDAGLQQGEVLAGGAINLLADRGFIAAAAGARFDAHGTAAALDIADAAPNGGYQRRNIASAGGSLTLRSPESIDFAAAFDAHAGVGDVPVAGGSATFQLTRQRGFSVVPQFRDTFSTDPRTLIVTGDASTVSRGRNGIGVVDTGWVRASGIDRLQLEAGDRIEFYSGGDLTLGRSLSVAAPLVGVSGDAINLAAPVVSLGTLVDTTAVITPAPLAGVAHFNVHGDLVELTGRTALTGVADATLTADSEIRLRGFEKAGTSTSTGELRLAGDLTLAAPVIYPTTETKFSIIAAGGANDRVRFTANGAPTTRTPFSVGGSLEVHARSIEQATRLVAPFGRLTLDATNDLTLADGSVTSVSADGTLLPFGHIQLGSQWVYDLGGTQLLDPKLPAPSVDLNAGDVRIAATATVDLAGGGDLYAYEWTPGTGGSRDALSPGATPGLYAILPQMRGSYAPYDPQESFGSALGVGDSIYLSGVPGLPDGVYPLLPARYALLPGAFLVSPVAGTTDAAGATSRLADGTPVATGFRTFGNTSIRDARTQGFAVRPGSYARSLATYTDSFASAFDAKDRPIAPDDAAHLSLAATHSFDLAGKVLSAAHGKGMGATIDLAAPDLAVLAQGAAKVDGAINVDASILQGWNSASLLLGGRRSSDLNSIDVISDTVTIGPGAQLSGTEILATAHDRISLAAGSSVSAGGSGARAFDDSVALHTDSDAAVLGVSATRALVVDRDAVSTRGEIVAAAGSRLASGGALLIDGPQGVQFDGTISGARATWVLGSNDIVFGGGSEPGRFNIGDDFASSLGTAARLMLAADRSLTFDDSLQLGGFDELVLDTPAILAGNDGVNARLAAERFTLRSGATGAAVSEHAGGTLTFDAGDLFVGPGSVGIAGFDSVSIDAVREVIGIGTANLGVQGDLTLTAGNIGTASDADLAISSTGTLTTARGTPLADASRLARELGGHVSLSGADVVHGGQVRVGSGRIDVAGTSSVTFASTAVLDASGTLVAAAGRTLGSAGGDIRVASGGTLDARAGSQVRVSGAGSADAGTVGFTSTGNADIAATLVAAAANDARGGSFVANLGALANFGALNDALEGGNFTQRRAFGVASGDLSLAAGHSIHAHDVSLATGSGRLTVAGTIDASSDNERGRIELSGGAGLTLAAGARIVARGDSGLGRGGSVLLATDTGMLELDAGSAIEVGGLLSAGELRLRAAATANGMNLGALASTISGVDTVALEPVLKYTLTATPTANELTQIRQSVTNYTNIATPALLARYADAGVPVAVRPGIDMSAAGNLTLGAIDLSSWRFAGEAARLAFAAGGNLTINGIVSDGFTVIGAGLNARTELAAGRSSSLSFSAGGDLRFANNARVRTGTGDLNISAGRDVVFGTGASVYTAGNAAEPTHVFTRGVSLTLPTGGGDLAIVAGRDVLGAPVTQSVGTWQLRQGRDQLAADGSTAPPGWGTDVQQFGWNAGTLGGGDLRVRAGNDIRDLSAAAADSASVVGGILTTYGGGVLQFDAGNDIDSAYVHVTRGDNRLRAGGEFGRSRATSFGELGSVFSVQTANLSLAARRGIALETVFNPTTLDQLQNSPFFRSYFLSYGNESTLRAASATGDVQLGGPTDQRLIPFLGLAVASTSDPTLDLLLPRAYFTATDGDIHVNGPLTLAPANDGQLDMFASRDIVGLGGGAIVMSDAIGMPTALDISAIGSIGINVSHSAASGRHSNDAQPVQITAGRDIEGLRVELAKFAELSAGRDLRNLAFTSQNVRDSDATLLFAGRDIVYDLDAGNSQIQVGGPGRLDVVAGRDVDLGFSAGISTVGRLLNPALATEQGADITVLAGAGSGAPLDAAKFIANIVTPTPAYRDALISFVAGAANSSAATFDAAVETFGTLATDVQRSFLVPLFFKELVASGREANNVPGAGFERGYSAIDALFPGSRGDAAASPYAGDLKLAFSRIYTLADADISLLVPGGLLNVGLANPPPGLAGSRKPSELGIVAQRAGSVRVFTRDDVLVNASRIFTLRGGDITIWSTLGDIDAGRGAKSAISAPPPTILVDASGKVTIDFAGAVAGSGIRAIVTDDDVKPGDVDLIAPAGIVDAGDAGIGSAGNLNVAAQQVVGLDNIQVGGASTGVPAETSSLGAALAGASAVSSSASSSFSDSASNAAAQQSAAPLADSAFGFLDVFLEGFGTEVCKPDDMECLKRSQK